MNIQKIFTILAVSVFLFLPSLVFAETGNPITFKIDIPPPLSTGTGGIPVLIERIITEAIMPIGGVIVIVMIIYAGFMYVTAAGDKTKIEKSHDALLYAVIGAAILLGARVLAAAIQATITQISR